MVFEGLVYNCACLWLLFYTLRKQTPPAWASRFTVPDPNAKAQIKYFKKIVLHGGIEREEESDSDEDLELEDQ